MQSLRLAAINRPQRKVAIITRTLFNRPVLLNRCIATIKAFIAAAGKSTEFTHYLVTSNTTQDTGIPNSITVDCGNTADTRYLLVEAANQQIDADLFWFIDDDDWMFPNEAERLALCINTAPQGSQVFVRSDLFREKDVESTIGGFPVMEQVVKYSANNYYESLTWDNKTPFCGVIFPRDVLTSIDPEMYRSQTLLEDYYTNLQALLKSDRLAVTVDKLYVGISATSPGNTISMTDRTPWHQAMTDLAARISADTRGANQLAAYWHVQTRYENLEQRNHELNKEVEELRRQVHNDGAMIDKLQDDIRIIKASNTWRLGRLAMKPLMVARGLKGVVRGR